MSSSNLASSFSCVDQCPLRHQRLAAGLDIPLSRRHNSVSVSQAAAWTWPKAPSAMGW
jgi:hypothetical protein